MGGGPAADWTLADWLQWQEQLNPRSIALGLERTHRVASRLDLLATAAITLTIGGTNGKGSSATLASGILQAAGYRVGRYLSPHLSRYNERIAVNGIEAADADLIRAFTAIEAARQEVPLTYFEFGTLAALWIFREAGCAVQVLEVGLGGRLDAVNILDADAALVTNVGLDHTDWLGTDREAIGFEKAGIFRPKRPAICAEPDPPASVIRHAESIGAMTLVAERDFSFELHEDRWSWQGLGQSYADLPAPALLGAIQFRNASGVLAALAALGDRLTLTRSAIVDGLKELRLAGRYQRLGQVIFDVAHNVESAQVLVDNLRADPVADPVAGRTLLVLGMLADKPVEAVCQLLRTVVDDVWFASLPGPRGLNDAALADRAAAGGLTGTAAGCVVDALHRAQSAAQTGDRIVVCGSFLTVSAALEAEAAP